MRNRLRKKSEISLNNNNKKEAVSKVEQPLFLDY